VRENVCVLGGKLLKEIETATLYLYFTEELTAADSIVNGNNTMRGSERLLLRYCRLRLLRTWSCVAQDGKLKHGVDLAVREFSGFHVKSQQQWWKANAVRNLQRRCC
jgi:hypothetical protein